MIFRSCLVVALALSPLGLGLLLPERHPATWIYPALILMPPMIFASHRALGPKTVRVVLWPLTVVLAAVTLLLILCLGSAFFAR